MNDFKPGDAVKTPDGTAATFVKHVGAPYGNAASQAVIQVGADTRVVDPVSLRRAA